MKRVLVTGAANMGKAGVATIVFKFGQAFDSDIIVYDYLMQKGLPELKFQEAIKIKGGKIYTMPKEKHNLFVVLKWLYHIMKNNHYEVIHINSDTAYVAAAYIYVAKKAKINKIFVHSHCTQIDDRCFFRRKIKILLHRFFISYVCENTAMYLACSRLAGVWMFGEKNVKSINYKTIYNGVEVESYLFNQDIRKKYRAELKLNKKYIIGHIGRFSYQKNHEFIVDVFSAYQKKYAESILVLVGTGELENEVRKQVKEKRIENKVHFLGLRDDIPALLSMFDVLIMPSRFEGLPVTMVEAQMADLPCVVSDNITLEAKFTDNVQYVNGYNLNSWIDAIEQYRTFDRKKNIKEKEISNFNIKNAAAELQKILRG